MSQRLRELIRDNIACLRQGLELLLGLDDELYDVSPPRLEPHRVGGHLRHCLEFYECFFAGLESGLVNYDSRRRNPELERSRPIAALRLLETIDRLREYADSDDGPLRVRVEGEAESEPTDSSAARELGFLLSHTIHHFALIAMTLQALGVRTGPTFGVSPSTLRYRAEAGVCAR